MRNFYCQLLFTPYNDHHWQLKYLTKSGGCLNNQILHPERKKIFELVQELKPNDHQARRTFGECNLFRVEAYYWFNGYVNQQNCPILSDANPQTIVKTPLHPQKVTCLQDRAI